MIRLLGSVRWIFDSEYRDSRRRQIQIKSGEMPLQIVDYTPGGFAVQMPVDMVDHWERMPADARAEFMADVDQNAADAAPGDDGLHDWRDGHG